MLTRHSPLHAHGDAEVGWLVGESDGQFHPVSLGTTAPGCLLKLKAHFRSDCVVEADLDLSLVASPNPNEKKKIPRTDPRVSP
jgi:hypothetical protein